MLKTVNDWALAAALIFALSFLAGFMDDRIVIGKPKPAQCEPANDARKY